MLLRIAGCWEFAFGGQAVKQPSGRTGGMKKAGEAGRGRALRPPEWGREECFEVAEGGEIPQGNAGFGRNRPFPVVFGARAEDRFSIPQCDDSFWQRLIFDFEPAGRNQEHSGTGTRLSFNWAEQISTDDEQGGGKN